MIYLVADTSACLTRQEAQQLQVLMVPMYYSRGGRMYTEGYVNDWQPQEGGSLTGHTTSQATSGAFLDIFNKLKRQGHQALCVTISSRLSGTYMNALSAAEESGDHVRVVDSRSTAGGIYLLLKQARALLNSGHTLVQAFEQLKSARDRLKTLFALQDMEPLRHSGRLGMVRLSVSAMLNVRPILSLVDGAVMTHAMARGRQVQMLKLLDGTDRAQGPIVVQHCADEEAAHNLAQRLMKAGHQVIVRRLGVVLTIHLGYPVLSTAWVE